MKLLHSIVFVVCGANVANIDVHAFQSPLSSLTTHRQRPSLSILKAEDGTKNDGNQQYRNVATEVLSNFMQKKENDSSEESDVIGTIDFQAAKQPIRDLATLAAVLDYELYQSEWFVTGKVNPVYFADNFCFQDPDVTLEGIEAYARGVNTLFDQETSRAEIIETVVNPELGDNIITCKWRLSGKANIGPAGLTIKPYIVYSDFTVQDGLIVRQEDRFNLPQWDILLSSLFPFLIGVVTKPPAPPVEPRVVPKPNLGPTIGKRMDSNNSPLAIFSNFFKTDSR